MTADRPLVTGSLELPPTAFMVFIYDESGGARTFNLLDASESNVSAFVEACETITPTLTGGDSSVDEMFSGSYRVLDGHAFATSFVPERTEIPDILRQWLLEGSDATREIKLVLKELRVYGKDDFVERSHQDSSSGPLGFLALTLPIPHEGGTLILHPPEGEQHVSSTSSLLMSGRPQMAFAAYGEAVEREVLPVTEGHRITLEYELYYAIPVKTSIPDSAISQQSDWVHRLEGLLDNPTLLPDGGLFCFGLRHSYSVPGDDEYGPLKFEPASLEADLKGVDLQIFRVLHNLGLTPEIQLSYDDVREEDAEFYPPCPTRGLTARPLDLLEISGASERTLDELIRKEGTLAQEGLEVDQVIWVTPVSECTHVRQIYASKEDKIAWVSYARANVCIVGRVKPYGDRVGGSKKRKRLTSEAEVEESLRPCPAKRRRVRFKEEVEEFIIGVSEPLCERFD